MIAASMTQNLSKSAQKTYTFLKELAAQRGTPREIEVSYSALTKLTARSLTTIKYHLKELEYHGWLELRHRYEGERIACNRYILKQ
jgi:DNA-binding transcriptional ArsR family regulator